MEDGQHNERLFIRRVRDQKIPHEMKTDGT